MIMRKPRIGQERVGGRIVDGAWSVSGVRQNVRTALRSTVGSVSGLLVTVLLLLLVPPLWLRTRLPCDSGTGGGRDRQRNTETITQTRRTPPSPINTEAPPVMRIICTKRSCPTRVRGLGKWVSEWGFVYNILCHAAGSMCMRRIGMHKTRPCNAPGALPFAL